MFDIHSHIEFLKELIKVKEKEMWNKDGSYSKKVFLELSEAETQLRHLEEALRLMLPRYNEIKDAAYYLYLNNSNTEIDNWLQAEKQVDDKRLRE